MKIKVTQIISAISVIAILQLLFFWIMPVYSDNFAVVYPFYTILTLCHTIVAVYLCTRFGHPSCFAPMLCGGVVTVAEILVALLMGSFCESTRSLLFVQGIIIISYVLVMSVFVGIAAKESANSTIDSAPVISYSTNQHAQDQALPQTVSQRRKPSSVTGSER